MKTTLRRPKRRTRIVSVDSCLLTAIISGDCSLPTDPATQRPIPRAQEIIDYWFSTLSEQSTELVIPTPVLSEVLLRSGFGVRAAINELKKNRAVTIGSFAEREAIELAEANQKHGKPRKRDEPWQKVKLDRQIAAVAKCWGVDVFFTMDKDLKTAAELMGLVVQAITDMPTPPAEQTNLFSGESSPDVIPISPGR